MDIFQIVAIAIVGAVLALTLKPYRPEFAMLLGLATGMGVLFFTVDSLSAVLSAFRLLWKKAGLICAISSWWPKLSVLRI